MGNMKLGSHPIKSIFVNQVKKVHSNKNEDIRSSYGHRSWTLLIKLVDLIYLYHSENHQKIKCQPKVIYTFYTRKQFTLCRIYTLFIVDVKSLPADGSTPLSQHLNKLNRFNVLNIIYWMVNVSEVKVSSQTVNRLRHLSWWTQRNP